MTGSRGATVAGDALHEGRGRPCPPSSSRRKPTVVAGCHRLRRRGRRGHGAGVCACATVGSFARVPVPTTPSGSLPQFWSV